nr:hypothetical protein [Tanacetum cinerariifolium]
MERFKNAILKQREKINNRMIEMIGLLKELTTRRTPEKVLIREEAKFPVTKNVNSISLARGEEERSDKVEETLDNTVKRAKKETEITVKEAERNDETKNELIKKAENKETTKSPSSQPVEYYLKHSINKKLIEGLVNNHRPAETDIRLSLASHSYFYPLGITEDVLVKVAKHVYPVYFVILDIKGDERRPFILGTSFLTMEKVVIKFDKGTITLSPRVQNEKIYNCKKNVMVMASHVIGDAIMKSISSLFLLFVTKPTLSLTIMGDKSLNRPRTLGDYSGPSHDGYRNAIELPEGAKVSPYDLAPSSWIIDSIDLNGATRIFSTKKTAKHQNDILMFQQHQDESLYDAWTRFKHLLRKVPHHGSLDYIDANLEHELESMKRQVESLMRREVLLYYEGGLMSLKRPYQEEFEGQILKLIDDQEDHIKQLEEDMRKTKDIFMCLVDSLLATLKIKIEAQRVHSTKIEKITRFPTHTLNIIPKTLKPTMVHRVSIISKIEPTIYRTLRQHLNSNLKMPILHSFEENKLEYEDEDEVKIKMMGTRMDKESL